ncbi:hairy/enhancer-of-split related with YRPW motif protein 2 [Platysternon megacephalum]|uniref:Hairy/enhancer-of-split related with YRPW motif protein 2 n=1 Tax=Platysternon megacephalum TaxID=55544 RepID=A0A4D9DUF9_9SAUR|nr:hairy/enhancer-of-split related with YRPW motif protein 2 [Platysternon megacephalum]
MGKVQRRANESRKRRMGVGLVGGRGEERRATGFEKEERGEQSLMQRRLVRLPAPAGMSNKCNMVEKMPLAEYDSPVELAGAGDGAVSTNSRPCDSSTVKPAGVEIPRALGPPGAQVLSRSQLRTGEILPVCALGMQNQAGCLPSSAAAMISRRWRWGRGLDGPSGDAEPRDQLSAPPRGSDQLARGGASSRQVRGSSPQLTQGKAPSQSSGQTGCLSRSPVRLSVGFVSGPPQQPGDAPWQGGVAAAPREGP